MSTIKKFVCMIFRPEGDCPYDIQGEEGEIIDQAAIHEQSEHGIEDTPETREKIKASLIDAGNSD